MQKQGGVNELTSHELRLDWTSQGALPGRLGIYHSDVDDDFRFANRRIPPLTSFTDDGAGPLDTTGFAMILRYTPLEKVTKAVFGQLSYKFTDGRMKVSGEARYQEQDRTFIDNPSQFRQTGTFNVVTPRFTAEYRLAPYNLTLCLGKLCTALRASRM